MAVLVTGGAGYIGSVVVDQLVDRGEHVVVLDNLSRSPMPDLPIGVEFVQADVGEQAIIGELVEIHNVESCIHLAGLIAVGESVNDPGLYLEHNVAQAVRLLRTLISHGVDRFVFSSSAAVYGDVEVTPISEDEPLRPTSPYGWTKMAVEQMLTMHDAADGLRSVSLRYFNAAGATERRHERHDPETHLIPLVVRATGDNAEPIIVFGSDYPTPDGTAIRDYIHVSDLADAHLLALDHLRRGGPSSAVNLGTGTGNTVLEVVDAVERAVGRVVARSFGPRRPGDPVALVASDRRARELLGWEPTRSSLGDIVDSVVRFAAH